jgi:hypothetical protein
MYKTIQKTVNWLIFVPPGIPFDPDSSDFIWWPEKKNEPLYNSLSKMKDPKLGPGYGLYVLKFRMQILIQVSDGSTAKNSSPSGRLFFS